MFINKPSQPPFRKTSKSVFKFINSKSAFVFFLILICITPTFGQEDVSSEVVAQGLALRFLMAIVAGIIALITRAFLLRRLNKLMLSESKKMVNYSSEEIENTEVKAHQALNVIEVNVKSELTTSDSNRDKLVAQAKKSINKQFIINLIIGFGYAIGYFFIFEGNSYILEIEYDLYITKTIDIDRAASLLKPVMSYRFFVFLFLIWNIIQFIGNRHQLNNYGKGSFGFIKPFFTLIFGLFQSFWFQVVAIILLMHTLLYGIMSMKLFLIASVVIHLFLWYQLKSSGRKLINSKLLILRVFLIGKTSTFTFKHLARLWKYFGTYFTVADPSFYKVNWKRRFNYMFPFYIIVVFFIYTLLTDSNKEDEITIFAGFTFLLLLGNIFMFMYDMTRMKQKFMSSPAALENRLKKLDRKPTKFDNTFTEEPVMCYDNTWKQAVDGLVETANVILMDLRGFSEANKGCAYEVNILFDSVNAERIVFMGYKDAIPLIKRVIEEQWEKLSVNSPNLKTDNPSTKLYIVDKENHRDVHSVLHLLLEATI